MKQVTITVTNEVADALATLCDKGRLKSDPAGKTARWLAFQLAGYARPWKRGGITEILIDRTIHIVPKNRRFGGWFS